MSTNRLNQDVGCSMDQSSVKILAEPRNEPASSSQDFLKKKKKMQKENLILYILQISSIIHFLCCRVYTERKFNTIYSSDVFNYPLFMF